MAGKRKAKMTTQKGYTKFTPAKRKKFLVRLAETGHRRLAAAHVGCSYDTVKKLYDKDDAFAAAWDDAVEMANEVLEAVLRGRAEKGVIEYQTFKGHIMYKRDPENGDLVKDDDGEYIPLIKRVFSDSLGMFLLKGNNPKKFGDKVSATIDHRHTGVLVVPAPISPEDYQKDALAHPRPSPEERRKAAE